MRRKIVKHGPSSLTISLPMKWAKKQGLKPGDELEIEEQDYGLVINKDLPQKERTAEINLTKESERYVRSHIGRLYRYGFTKVVIRFDDPELIKKIKHSTNNLIGADIVDLEKNKCIIKMFPIEEFDIGIDKQLVKIFSTLKYMFSLVKEDMESDEFKREETLNELRNNNWTIKDYALRNAFLQKLPYGEFSILNIIFFAYEKIGTNLLGFYRMYLEGKKRGIDVKKLHHVFEKLEYFLDWFIKASSRRQPITHLEETNFRKEMRNFHIYLFNELHSDTRIDHPFLTITYFAIELLDSSVSFLQVYKRNYEGG